MPPNPPSWEVRCFGSKRKKVSSIIQTPERAIIQIVKGTWNTARNKHVMRGLLP